MSVAEAHVNHLSGSPLNRLSWLRPSAPFVNALAASPKTRWIVFRSGYPLVFSNSSDPNSIKLALPTSDDVRAVLGPHPFFGQGKRPGQAPPENQSDTKAEDHNNHNADVHLTVRLHGPPVVFLGLHEPESVQNSALPSSDFAFAEKGVSPAEVVERVDGTPYFAVDVASGGLDDAQINAFVEKTRNGFQSADQLEFIEPRSASTRLEAFEAAVFAEARSMIDWNVRNKFCPACGARVHSTWAGWKLVCSTLLPWTDNTGRDPCPSTKGLHNFAHPRTDAVVIMAVIDEAGEKILLGRSRRFPVAFYSTLAGFIEPGESFEDAVRREIWEEAGVRIWGVRYHSGQPWPYPANLMVGFYAFADPTQPVRVDLDNELVDARWYTRGEIISVLEHPLGTDLARREYKKFDEDGAQPRATREGGASQKGDKSERDAAATAPPPFRVPPRTAIAGVLISDWAYGRVEGLPGNAGSHRKGNL